MLRWQSISLAERMGALRGDDRPRRNARVITNGQQQIVQHDDALAFATATDLIVVGRSGGMARFSYERDESDPTWKADHSLYFVEHAARHDMVLAVAGEALPSASRQKPPKRIAMVDPTTGEEYASYDIPDDDPIRWLRITPRGEILFATRNAIRAIDATTGSLLWANTVAEVVAEADRAWVFGDYVILGDVEAKLRSIRLADGRAEDNFQPLRDLTWDPTQVLGVHVVGDRALVHFEQRIVWFDRAGQFAGQDVITSDRDYTHVVVGSPVVYAIRPRAPKPTVYRAAKSPGSTARQCDLSAQPELQAADRFIRLPDRRVAHARGMGHRRLAASLGRGQHDRDTSYGKYRRLMGAVSCRRNRMCNLVTAGAVSES